MCVEQEHQEHKLRYKKERKKHPQTHTFFPSLKLTQKNNTQISNVTTPTTPLSLSSLKNVIPTTAIEAKNPNPIQKPQSKHKISLHINPPSNGGAEAKNPGDHIIRGSKG